MNDLRSVRIGVSLRNQLKVLAKRLSTLDLSTQRQNRLTIVGLLEEGIEDLLNIPLEELIQWAKEGRESINGGESIPIRIDADLANKIGFLAATIQEQSNVPMMIVDLTEEAGRRIIRRVVHEASYGPLSYNTPFERKEMTLRGKVYAVPMQKGGTGKTTTAIQFTGQGARRKKKMLVVDWDPQASLTRFFLKMIGKNMNWLASQPTMYNFIVERKPIQPIQINQYISLLPANNDLAALEQLLPSLPHTKEKPNYALRDILWPSLEDCDCVIIDPPPAIGLLMKNALAAVTPDTGVIIPVETEEMAISLLPNLLATIKDVQTDESQGHNPDLRIKYILPTKYDGRIGLEQGWLQALKAQFGAQCYPNPVQWKAAYGKAIDAGTDVVFQEPSLEQYWAELADACLFGPFPTNGGR